MTFVLSLSSITHMAGVHPDLVRVVRLGLSYSPHDFAVSEGVRSIKRQMELRARGSSLTLNSKHLMQSDGFGHAVDVVAVGDLDDNGVIDAQDRALTWNRDIYSAIAVAMKMAATEVGVPIRWGGDFKSFFDGVHFELVG